METQLENSANTSGTITVASSVPWESELMSGMEWHRNSKLNIKNFRTILNATLYLNGLLVRHRDITTADGMNVLFGEGLWILGQDQVSPCS